MACGSIASIQQHDAMKVQVNIGLAQTTYLDNSSTSNLPSNPSLNMIRDKTRHEDPLSLAFRSNFFASLTIGETFVVHMTALYRTEGAAKTHLVNLFSFYRYSKKDFFLSPILVLGETSKTSGVGLLFSLLRGLIHASFELKLSVLEDLQKNWTSAPSEESKSLNWTLADLFGVRVTGRLVI